MQLYSALSSPFGLGVELFLKLALQNNECIVTHIDLKSGQTCDEWFRKINPKGQVPVLVDDDFILSESTSILRFLAQSRSDTQQFYPQNPRGDFLVTF